MKILKVSLNIRAIIIGLIVYSLVSCVPLQNSNLRSTKEREMTVGIVQKEIIIGMDQSEVATALGSPNIVTRDKEASETWIYDKIATEASYSKSSASIGGATTPGISLLLGLISVESGASSSTQKTLTVIIKFDDERLVKSYNYHASKF